MHENFAFTTTQGCLRARRSLSATLKADSRTEGGRGKMGNDVESCQLLRPAPGRDQTVQRDQREDGLLGAYLRTRVSR